MIFKYIYLLFFLIWFNFSLVAQYNSIKIGEQTWMVENLNVEKFRNGDKIKEAKTIRKWRRLTKRHKAAWCFYENSSSDGNLYGKLYNLYAIVDERGLAPCGWHIPTDGEWSQLSEFLGGEDIAGIKLKAENGWKKHVNDLSNGNNKSGFKGFPGGYRFSNGLFFYIGNFGYWWSSTISKDGVFTRVLSFDKSSLDKEVMDKFCGLSVRCLKD